MTYLVLALFSLALLANLLLKENSNVYFAEGNHHGYTENYIQIYGRGQEISLDPSIKYVDDWNIEPELPEGLRLFSKNWEINGDILDSYGRKTCTISPDSRVMCWNINDFLVDYAPMHDANNGVFKQISVGGGHVCGLYDYKISVDIVCSGSDWRGQLGDGRKITDSLDSAVIKGLNGSNWTGISLGEIHSCAHNSLEEIYCWGGNNFGQVGDNSSIDSKTPKIINIGNNTIKNIESGSYHNCLLSDKGEVHCWGWNSFGQIGDGSFSNAKEPVRVVFPEGAIIDEIASGLLHNCAKSISGDIFCWGDNREGQINKSSKLASYNIPVKINNIVMQSDIMILSHEFSCFFKFDKINCIGGDYIENMSKSELNDFSVGDDFICFLLDTMIIQCNNFAGENIELPVEVRETKLDLNIPAGRIAGFAMMDVSKSYLITSMNKDERISSQVYILINYGEDQDSDGWRNSDETECGTKWNDMLSYPLDTDLDQICDNIDWDRDGDGIANEIDRFPLDSSEWEDGDNDGIGKNEDGVEISQVTWATAISFLVLMALFKLEISKLNKS